jgi:CheY-like chemotaxis protein
MPNPTILLADDDVIFLENVREFLSARDYDVISTTDPAEAKRMLQEIPIALAFLDIQFDPADDRDEIGIKVAEDTIDLSSVPKIILTKFDENTPFAVRSLRPRHDGKAPAVNFVSKRDGFDRLLEVIENHLNRARIFLSYVREDQVAVNAIHDALSSVGFIPWIDRTGIPGGAEWKLEISKAIKAADFFVVCASKKSFEQSGYFQREIREALEILSEMPRGQIYMVPVRLEEFDITDPDLEKLQWVDLFGYPEPPANQDGFHRLVNAIKHGMRQRTNRK